MNSYLKKKIVALALAAVAVALILLILVPNFFGVHDDSHHTGGYGYDCGHGYESGYAANEWQENGYQETIVKTT